MALLKLTTIVTLLGLVWAQETYCLSPAQILAEQTLRAQTAGVSPIYSTGTLQYFDEFGNPIFSNCYPFYNSYGYTIPLELLSNPLINQQLLDLSNTYGIPLDDMYQLYNLLNKNMPNVTPDLDLSMLGEIAQALQQEKLYWSTNPYDMALRSQLTLDELRNYLPPGLPDSYLNMMAYMDYLVPNLSPSTLASIQKTIEKYCPPSLRSNLDYITFQMQTAARYAFASQLKYVPAY